MEKAEQLVVPRAGIEPTTLRFSVAQQREQNQRDEAENAANRPIDNVEESTVLQNIPSAYAPSPMDALHVIHARYEREYLTRYRDVAGDLRVSEKEAKRLVASLKADGLVFRAAAFSFDDWRLAGSGFAPTEAGYEALRKYHP